MTPDSISKIFDKLEVIAVDVGIIKDKMPHLATKDHVDLKIAEHAASPSKIPGMNGPGAKRTAALVTVIAGLTSAIWALVQYLAG